MLASITVHQRELALAVWCHLSVGQRYTTFFRVFFLVFSVCLVYNWSLSLSTTSVLSVFVLRVSMPSISALSAFIMIFSISISSLLVFYILIIFILVVL
jgi:hypothetical protein